MNSGMTTSPPQSSIHIVTVQLDARTTARDVVKLALAELFGFHSEADWRNRQNILERYALFETEFVDGGDEDVSLAAAVTRRPSVASVVPSSTPTSTTTTRRIHRIVRGNEHPLIIHANWPNYKPLPRRRRASDSYSSPVPHQQRRRRASSNDRHFDFFVAELTDEDRVVAALSNGDYRPAYAEAMAQGAFGTTMSSSMLEMSEERLRRRLAIVNKEELRVVEECRDRYARLKALVTARAKSLLGGGNYNERGAAPRM